MLGDMDIEVDTAVEETPLAEEPEKAVEPEWTEAEPEPEEAAERAPGETADPVRMYLQEMGGVPLLTREEEVAIAKEIESGEREVREAVFSLDLALQYVLTLADKLRRGEIEARHIFGDDEPETEPAEGTESKEDKRAEAFLRQVSKLKRLAGERDKLVAEAGKAKTTKARHARIEKRLVIIAQAVREVLLETQIGAKHVQMLVDKLKEAQRLIDTDQHEVRRLEQRLGHPAADILKHAARIRADEKDAARTASRLFRAPAAQVVEAADAIREARRKAQQVLREVGMSAEALRASLHTIRLGEMKAQDGKKRLIETINKVIRTSRYLVQQYGREPTAEEIAQQMEMPADKVRKVLKIVKEPVSLETPIGDDEESSLGDFVEDRQTLSPADAAMALSLEEQTRKVLATLTPREEQILRLRFGIGEKSDYTLEEVGQRFAVTRERIRQIEAKALRKLRSPNRARTLETFVQRQ